MVNRRVKTYQIPGKAPAIPGGPTGPEWSDASGKLDRTNERVVDLRDHLNTTGAVVQTTVLQALLDSLDDGMTVLNPSGAIVNLNAEIAVNKRLRFAGAGEYRFTAGFDSATPGTLAGFHAYVDGCVFDCITATNPNESRHDTGAKSFAIYAEASEVMVLGCQLDTWQSGVGVAPSGEYHCIIIEGNRIKDVLGAGGGAASGSSNGEDRGDGIVVWGAATSIANNIVNCKPGRDARVGIHVEALTDLEETPWLHSDALGSITGNIVYGQFRRSIVDEGLDNVTITGNAVADATWWSIVLAGECRGCTVANNPIKWTRTSSDNQGSAWAPSRAPIVLINTVEHCTVTNNPIWITSGSDADFAIDIGANSTGGEEPAHNTISGNLIWDQPAVLTVGIFVNSTAGEYNVIDGNQLAGIAGTAILVWDNPNTDVVNNWMLGTGASGSKAVATNGGATDITVMNNRARNFEFLWDIVNCDDAIVTNNFGWDATYGLNMFGSTGNPFITGNLFRDVSTPYVNIPAGASIQAYTPTNVTTDRAFDADTVVVAELADVVGTLIADLQAQGIVR